MIEVGERIRSMMPLGMNQRDLARRADMTPDALSRALNGQRGLSPAEVASIAKTLGADTHWLITGAPDPLAVSVAARHSWDARRRVRVNDGQEEDRTILDQVVSLYRAAYPQGPAGSGPLPATPAALRNALGSTFVRNFANAIESELGVDVIRIPGLTTDYSIRIGERGVIVLATQSSWFRSNWSLAHELGHLALGHHTSDVSAKRIQRDEKAADNFAGGVLVPNEVLEQFDSPPDARSVAQLVWNLGVSTEAIRIQLRKAKRPLTTPVAEALSKSTPLLMRQNVTALATSGEANPIVAREQAASSRRFPVTLLSALQDQIDLGAASPELLAWALDVPVDDIDFPEPIDETASEIAERINADRPTAADWHAILAARA